MKPKAKILLLAVAPLLFAIAAIGGLLVIETQRLEQRQAQVLEDVLLSAKREELRSYIALALTSIDNLYGAGRDDEPAKEQVKAILANMNFGDDGYFYVYDREGLTLVHPRQPDLVGQNLWNRRDTEGTYMIRELIARAHEGGGYQRYLWPKPSTGRIERKLGYSVELPRWGWMLGTGIYLDDVDAAAAKLRGSLLASVRQTLLGLATVAMIAAIGVFAGGLALNISEQRQADRKLKALAHRVVSSQEDERARVSRELHDHICQLLVSIKYQFELVGHRLAHPGNAPVTAIDKEIGALSQAIGEVRRISHDLRPALLDDLGLPAALEHIGNELAQRSGLTVTVSPHVHEERLPELQAVSLFRVAQEALRNAERHAGASHIDIRLDDAHDRLELRITDDGRGFDVQNVEHSKDRGIGLTNMRERVERNGGSFQLISQPGRTSLIASFPLAVPA
ncbi:MULTISPECIES: cache domain-containing protein [unclassified Variovorax]|jgi:two-component system NarL family sensor kinase|uniref:cache domain-containing protein n=1 Tax=unclassified Variovorax TaxID=663243 RepID=UPI002B22E751|nr:MULTISPECIES: cache domain-containing protein [unclassified Variovorax]MEB0058360.1 cache domain-containing protein [Variovorax sp. LG9.2]MEB0111870.1 cache domain-containing protein [Variovorax sp. RTB1]